MFLDADDKKELQELNAGDQVFMVIFAGIGFPNKWSIEAVTRTTKTQVIIAERRFAKKSGSMIGNHRGAWIYPMKYKEQADRAIERYNRWTYIRTLRGARKDDWAKVPTELMLQIIAAFGKE